MTTKTCCDLGESEVATLYAARQHANSMNAWNNNEPVGLVHHVHAQRRDGGMQKKLAAFLLMVFAVFLTVSCSESGNYWDGRYWGNGYVEMEFTEQAYSYLGNDNGRDYDAKCANEHGEDYLSFLVEGTNNYACLRKCSNVGQESSYCELVNNTHYGFIDITTVQTCKSIDGVKVFVETAYHHCNHSCTEDKSKCD